MNTNAARTQLDLDIWDYFMALLLPVPYGVVMGAMLAVSRDFRREGRVLLLFSAAAIVVFTLTLLIAGL